MAVSEAQKRAADRYHREHMATIGCKLKKEEAQAFKNYAEAQNKTANALLKEFVYSCIGKNNDKKENV